MDGKHGVPLITGARCQVLESNLTRLPFELDQRTNQAEFGLVTKVLIKPLKPNRSAFGNLFLDMSRKCVCSKTIQASMSYM